jgi:hypothetical protein
VAIAAPGAQRPVAHDVAESGLDRQVTAAARQGRVRRVERQARRRMIERGRHERLGDVAAGAVDGTALGELPGVRVGVAVGARRARGRSEPRRTTVGPRTARMALCAIEPRVRAAQFVAGPSRVVERRGDGREGVRVVAARATLAA